MAGSNFDSDEKRKASANLHGRVLLLAIVAGSAILVSLTYIVKSSPGTLPFERQWHLGWERNVATWWSGLILFLGAVLAWDGAVRGKLRISGGDPRACKAWLAIGAIILFLSADEVSSFHERLGSVGPTIGMGRWGLALCLGALLGLTFLWSALQVMRQPFDEKVRLFLICVSFSLFVSVAGQEWLEHNLDWRGSGFAATRVAIEEGCELIAAMLIIYAVARKNAFPEGPFAFFSAHRERVFWIAMALAPLALLLSLDDRPDKGVPLDWLASALLWACAALLARLSLERAGQTALLIVSGLMMTGAMTAVAVEPQEFFAIGSFVISRRAAILAAVAVPVVIRFYGEARAASLILGAIVLAFLCLPTTSLYGHIASCAIAFCCFWLISAVVSARTISFPAP